ncbi:hypothetical protein BH18ACT13_BH18ACT13_06610 [soil metagenome]
MSDRRGVSGPEDEQEVDLASAWKRLEARWWLPVAGLLVGAVIGLALALSGGSVWRAETIVYLGQPFAPLGGGQIQSLATNPRTVGEIVRSEAALRAVSNKTGIPVSKLRSSISTKELTSAGPARGGITPLIESAVKGDAEPRKIEDAADALAARVVQRVSVFVAQKIELLEAQVAVAESQLQAIEGRIEAAQRQQTELLGDESIPLEQRLLVNLNLNSTITTADARRAALQGSLVEANQLLNLAKSVESSRVVEPAAAVKTTARSSRTSLLLGALLGLLVGAIMAVAAEPFLARRRRDASSG